MKPGRYYEYRGFQIKRLKKKDGEPLFIPALNQHHFNMLNVKRSIDEYIRKESIPDYIKAIAEEMGLEDIL